MSLKDEPEATRTTTAADETKKQPLMSHTTAHELPMTLLNPEQSTIAMTGRSLYSRPFHS
jgi:hypothetical protein